MLVWILLLLVVLIAALGLVPPALQRARKASRDLDQIYADVSHQVSDRLQFRRPVQADRTFYELMARDPVAAQNNGWNGDEVEWVQRRFEDEALFAQLQISEIVAFERSTGNRVGTATFSKSPRGDDDARSIGIHVHPDHRSRGYGCEIMAAAIVLLQRSPYPVHVGTRVTNIGMQKIMQRLGFTPEATTDTYTAPDGKSYDAFWYQCGAETHPPADLRLR